MPSVSAKQRRFMAAAAADPSFAKGRIPQSVAREFASADRMVAALRKKPRKKA